MTQALLYTELQIAAQIADAPWRDINARIKTKPGFINCLTSAPMEQISRIA
jgi:hypothetical protein